MMVLKRASKLLSLICIAALLTACSQSKPQVIETSTAVQSPLSIQELDVYGDVSVDKSEEIIIDFPAIVTEVYVRDGDSVKKGDKLFTLDFEDYKLQIKSKENEIQMDEIQLKELEINSNPQMLEAHRLSEELKVKQGYVSSGEDPDLKPLKGSLDILKEEIILAANQHETNKKLFEAELISPEEFKLSEQNLKGKQKEEQDTLTAIEKIKTNRGLEINALTAALKSTSVQSNNTDQQKTSHIGILKLKIETSKLVLTSMKNKLNKPYLSENDIISPEDHLIIYDINGMKGSQIGSGPGAIVKALYQDTLYVTADIPEESLPLVNVGDAATIVLAANSQQEISGKISKISNRAIEKDGDIVIEAIIEIEKGKELLKPGLTVDIKLFCN